MNLDTPINGPINVGCTDEATILDVANIIKKLLHVDGNLILNSAPKGSVTRSCPDISLLKSTIDYQYTVDLTTGIEKTLKDLKCV